MTVINLSIETWGGKYIVVGNFHDLTIVPRQEFKTYREALHFLLNIVRREEIRHEAGIGSDPIG